MHAGFCLGNGKGDIELAWIKVTPVMSGQARLIFHTGYLSNCTLYSTCAQETTKKGYSQGKFWKGLGAKVYHTLQPLGTFSLHRYGGGGRKYQHHSRDTLYLRNLWKTWSVLVRYKERGIEVSWSGSKKAKCISLCFWVEKSSYVSLVEPITLSPRLTMGLLPKVPNGYFSQSKF